MTLEVAIRVTCLLALGAVGGRLMSPAAASTRHRFRWLIVVLALTLPLLVWVVPGWSLARTPATRELAAILDAGPKAPSPSDLPPPDSPADGQGFENLSQLARIVWLSGVTLVLGYHGVGYLVLWRVRRRADAAPAAWRTAAARLSDRLGIRPVPEVNLSRLVPGPLVTGILRPVVLVPVEAADWSHARRDATLLHELAHVRRRDLQAQGLAQILCAVHWFNPLAWLSARALRREQELCCDDEVLRHGVPAVEYAGELLAIAAAALGRHRPMAALPMARTSEMESRLVSMLGSRRRQTSRAARVIAPLAASVLGILVAGATTAAPAANGGADLAQRHAPAVQHPAWSAGPPTRGRPDSTGDLESLLAATDPKARERATMVLALSPGDEVIPALLQALTDPASSVREQAAVGLAWRQHPDVVPFLLDAAADPVAGVREKVLVALALTGDLRARAAVDAARTDPDAAVRDKAQTLARLR